jgi:hypothetical protein
VVSQNYYKWLVQGKLFEAGFGAEDTAADSQASIDDTLVTFALQAGAGSKIVIPLYLRLAMTAEGGALGRADVAFTKPAALCATALTLTGGRAMTSIHNMYRTVPAQNGPTASALYGAATTFAITASALVAADYVDYQRRSWIDNAISVGLPMLGGGTADCLEWNFMNQMPRGLTAGAAMLVYINTGTSDSTWFPYVQWAELDVDDLI